MNIKQLESFIAVAEELNFTKAAKKIYVAQSSLSQQISDMENVLQVTLFNRTKRSVSLTPAGEYFYNVATSLVTQYNEAVRKVQSIGSGVQETLSIGFYGQCCAMFMPNILYDFRQDFPDVEIFCQEYHSHRSLLNALREHEIEVAATMWMGDFDAKDLLWHPCLSEQAAIVFWRGHPMADRKEVGLEELRDETFIFLAKSASFGGYYSRLALCQKSGFEPQKIIEANTLNTMMTLVSAKEGISIHSTLLEQASIYNLSFVPLKHDSADQIFSIGAFTTRKAKNSLCQVFCDSMMDTLQTLRAARSGQTKAPPEMPVEAGHNLGG